MAHDRIMHMRFLFTCILIWTLLIPTAFTFAHGTGVSYEENKDGYKVDIGHDKFITAEESTRFDFTLYPLDISHVEGEVFTDVWVTIIQDKKIFFAGGVHKPVFGTTGFTYVFPKEGTYTISARFQKEGATIVKTEFPFTVLAPPVQEKKTNPYIALGIAGLVGFLFGGTLVMLGSRFFLKKKTII